MKTIEARITKNIKQHRAMRYLEHPGGVFFDRLSDEATCITVDPDEIGVNQFETARTDSTRTAVTIGTQRKSRSAPGDVIHLGFQ